METGGGAGDRTPLHARHPVRLNVRPGTRAPVHLARAFRRAFVEFLSVPLFMLAGFAALGAVTVFLDLSPLPPLRDARVTLDRLIPSQVAIDLLAQVAPAVLGVASLTFSVLLVAVQQNASLYTPVVFDEFLRRRGNQIHFGYFVGLSFYAFLLLASRRPGNHLSFGAVILFVLTTIALVMLMTLIYGTINQMRPASVLSATWRLALRARHRRRRLLSSLRPAPLLPASPAEPVCARQDGYLVDLRFKRLRRVLERAGPQVEVVFEHPVGTYLAAGDLVGHVRAADPRALRPLAARVEGCLVIDTTRDVRTDPAYAVEQIAGIAWTAYSSAQHSPLIGLAAMRVLADLFERSFLAPPLERRGVVPVVYPDVVPGETLDRLATIGFLAVEARNAGPCTEVLMALAQVVPQTREEHLPLLEDRVWRLLPVVTELTSLPADLEEALRLLSRSLAARGRRDLAERLVAVAETHHRRMRGCPGG
ncbi:DUF2254 family protein [Nonomuraea candida]|uniref:DUF2254 family protein n=1 Tax=Nonomuraea candida TaxID=359159 RepID=UPI0005BCE47F|nr:DUF2254 family protein [Nonomuraea candida]